MQDRASTHPGRVVLTPVAGQTNTYDMTRADEPTVAGTPLNKATFLTDATAAAIAGLGVSSPSLPTEALTALAGILSNMGVSDVCHIDAGTYVGTGVYNAPVDLTFSITPKFVIIGTNDSNCGVPSDTTILTWINGQTASKSSNSNYVQWSLNGKTLRRTNHTYLAANQMMNTSGATYYYMAVGTK